MLARERKREKREREKALVAYLHLDPIRKAEVNNLEIQSMDNAVCLFLHFHLRAIRAPNSLGAQKDFSWI